MSPFLVAAALSTALIASPVAAQSGPVPSPGDPLDAQAGVPPLNYRSALAAYRPNVQQPVGAWRDLNDGVGRIGGWRAYAKQARQPDAEADAGTPRPPRATP